MTPAPTGGSSTSAAPTGAVTRRLPRHERPGFVFAVFIVLAVLLVVAVLLGVGRGTISLSPQQVLEGIFGAKDYAWHRVVWDIRLPRVLLAGLVGMNLATSGAILQAVMGNPLADPSIIGVSSGAGLVGIGIIVLFPGHLGLVTPGAFVGAMIAAIAIYLLAWNHGIQPLRIILAGVAVSSLFGAGISAVMVLFSDRLQGALLFMNGSMSLHGWSEVRMLLPYTVVGLGVALFACSRLNVLVLGDAVARSLGMNVQANRLFFTAVAALLAASSVSAVGLIGFVGLIVPHIIRITLGTNHTSLIPGSILLGSSLLIFSDLLSRILFSPIEIPVGITMTVLGVPFFLLLLRKAL